MIIRTASRLIHYVILPVVVLMLISCDGTTTMTPTNTPQSLPPQSLTPTNTPLSAEAWLTLGDGSRKLSPETALPFTQGTTTSGNLIQVNHNVLFQKFEGAGASLTESSAWLIMSVLDNSQRQQLMKDLFTRQGMGIGLSYLRQPMGSSDFAFGDYSYDDQPTGKSDSELNDFSIAHDRAYIIPALKLALELNPQLHIMGTPWSPPAWMKKDNQFHGSYLLADYFQSFAEYHVRFIQAYADEGIPVDSITPQNEPMYATQNYPTMFMSAEDQKRFIRDYLGPALKGAGLDTRIIIFDHNWDLVDYPLEVLADPSAAAFVDGVAFHCYGGDVSAQSRVHDLYPDKGIWFTECSGGDWAPNFSDNLSWNLRNLVIGNFRNWGKSVILWNLALDENSGPQNNGCGDCRGVVTINQSTGDITYNEEYYVLGHITKFVDPGAYRADSTQAGDGVPNNVAFLNPDGSIVLIVQADSTTTFSVGWDGKVFEYHLPSAGVVTFKWKAGITPGPTATAVPYSTATPRPISTAHGMVPSSNQLADFENTSPESLYSVSNASVSLGEIPHEGKRSLLSDSASGEWHVVGVYLAASPLDLTSFKQICFWVYDTTVGDSGNADNTIGIRLVDVDGNREEHWSDHAAVGINPRTKFDSWVQMCFNLSAYPQVNLANITNIEFNSYWAGKTYYDDLIVQ